jgi:hypothetical protein
MAHHLRLVPQTWFVLVDGLVLDKRPRRIELRALLLVVPQAVVERLAD